MIITARRFKEIVDRSVRRPGARQRPGPSLPFDARYADPIHVRFGVAFHPSDGGGDMARLFSIKPGITLRGRKFLGIRGWNGKPTHPPLTDFPIVCYVLAALFDVLSWLGWFGSGGRFSSRDLFRAASAKRRPWRARLWSTLIRPGW